MCFEKKKKKKTRIFLLLCADGAAPHAVPMTRNPRGSPLHPCYWCARSCTHVLVGPEGKFKALDEQVDDGMPEFDEDEWDEE